MSRVHRVAALITTLAALAFAGCGDDAEEGAALGGPDAGSDALQADAAYPYADWDVNGDRALSRDEFGTWGKERRWRSRDADGFAALAWELWNVDRDSVLTEREWSEATDRWYGDAVPHGHWANWDEDGDGRATPAEVRGGMEAWSLVERADTDGDGTVDDDELADWWFSVWDLNDDASVDTSEWDWGAQYGYTELGDSPMGEAAGREPPGP